MEVAGLVLGALPICMAAISQYDDALDTGTRFVKWRLELPQYVRRLAWQRRDLELSMQLLLRPIRDAKTVEEMLRDPTGSRWKDVDILCDLWDAHGPLYSTFEDAVMQISERLKTLMVRLSLCSSSSDNAHQELDRLVKSIPLLSDGRYHFKKRLTFAFGRKKSKDLLDEIEQSQRRLDSLMNKNEKVRMQISDSKSNSASLAGARRQTSALHSVLTNVFQCPGHEEHRAHLLLERRESKRDDGASTQDRRKYCNRYDLAFSSPGGCLESEVHIPDGSASLPSHCRPLPGTVIVDINDVCSTIEKHVQDMPRVGFHLDLKSSQKFRGVYRPLDQTRSGIRAPLGTETIGLRALIAASTARNATLAPLSLSQRALLAIIVASSVQQLYTTAWLPELWSKDDLVFLTYRQTHSIKAVDVTRPYLVHHARQLSSGQTLTDTSTLPMTDNVPKHKRNKLLMLGVLLAELYLGKPIESHRLATNPDCNVTGVYTKANALNDWIEEVGGKLPDSLLGAIGECQGLDKQPDEKVSTALAEMIKVLERMHEIMK